MNNERLEQTMLNKTAIAKAHFTAAERKQFGQSLYKLSDHLEDVPDRKYDHDMLMKVGRNPVDPAPACGTSGCALGHAIVSGKFPALHLKMVREAHDKVGDRLSVESTKRSDSYANISERADVVFGDGAWELIFSLDAFSKPPTRREVIKRIDRVALEVFGERVAA